MSPEKILLSSRSLRVGYLNEGIENILFDDLNLELPEAKLVCFMGPNGVGKSSLIRTLAGIQKPLHGTVSISTNKISTSEKIAVVLTDKITSMNMTVYDLVSFGRYPYLQWNISLSREDHEHIARAMSITHIEHLSEKPVHELSDGQLQMVMIARALAQDTPIVLLDEPTAHLDLNNRVEIMKLLKKLSRSTKKSILISTHELDLALQTADWIWLSGNNKNVLSGIPEDLVLEGAFDSIFKFKGFDLKTGKVQHEANRGLAVSVTGEGYPLLWTQNALERSGFEIAVDRSEVRVSIVQKQDSIRWLVFTPNGEKEFHSLSDVLKFL